MIRYFRVNFARGDRGQMSDNPLNGQRGSNSRIAIRHVKFEIIFRSVNRNSDRSFSILRDTESSRINDLSLELVLQPSEAPLVCRQHRVRFVNQALNIFANYRGGPEPGGESRRGQKKIPVVRPFKLPSGRHFDLRNLRKRLAWSADRKNKIKTPVTRLPLVCRYEVRQLVSDFSLLAGRTKLAFRKNILANVCWRRTILISVLSVCGFAQRLVVDPCEHMDSRLDEAVSHAASAAEKVNSYSSSHYSLFFEILSLPALAERSRRRFPFVQVYRHPRSAGLTN